MTGGGSAGHGGSTQVTNSTENPGWFIGAVISPKLTGDWREAAKHGLLLTHPGRNASVVTFDIGITVKGEEGKKAGIGVVAGVFALGGQGQTSTESIASNRVKFSVTIAFPQR